MPSPKLRAIVRPLVLLVVVVGVAIAAVLYVLHKPTGDPAPKLAGLEATKTYDCKGGIHTKDPVTYDQTPPAGGPHDPAWEDCGTYARPIRNENGVHALEHGTVWITYRPGLDQADIDKLAATLPQKGIISPYPGLPAPVVVTVWNAQLQLTGPDDPRLATFIKDYGSGRTAPENYASCAGGVHEYASAANP